MVNKQTLKSATKDTQGTCMAQSKDYTITISNTSTDCSQSLTPVTPHKRFLFLVTLSSVYDCACMCALCVCVCAVVILGMLQVSKRSHALNCPHMYITKKTLEASRHAVVTGDRGARPKVKGSYLLQ